MASKQKIEVTRSLPSQRCVGRPRVPSHGDQAICHGLAFLQGMWAPLGLILLPVTPCKEGHHQVTSRMNPPILASSYLLAWGLAFALNTHIFFLLQFWHVQKSSTSEGKAASWVLMSCFTSKLLSKGAGLDLYGWPFSTFLFFNSITIPAQK